MESPDMFTDPSFKPILSVEMHTTGEPTRIIYKGFANLQGTLLEQRAQAKRDFDHVRTRLMLEPRGHFDMYGAVLRPKTELTESGEAHMGVLFMTNDGFSTMCGHATIALGRFLVDMHDLAIFPKRQELVHDPVTKSVALNLHAPCGLVKVAVPTTEDGLKADPQDLSHLTPFHPSPQVSKSMLPFLPISVAGTWKSQHSELGFLQGLAGLDLEATNKATRLLKAAINANDSLRYLFTHPDHEDLGFLYSIIIVDDSVGTSSAGTKGVETGLCYFADQQIDRSPTGSGVAARIALAHAKGLLCKGETWTYHSLVSNAFEGRGCFTGTVIEELQAMDSSSHQHMPVRVRVQGFAYYTSFHSFIVEDMDPIGDRGFTFNRLGI